MNLNELQRKLIKAARADPPNDRVPYGFERRIMAALNACPTLDEWGLWARALWQATAPCLAVMILLAAWALLSPATPAASPGSPTVDMAQDLENTVLAATEQEPATDAFR